MNDERKGRPPMRVIVTGRPSRDVSETDFLLDKTPILTLKPLTATQLETYIDKRLSVNYHSSLVKEVIVSNKYLHKLISSTS